MPATIENIPTTETSPTSSRDSAFSYDTSPAPPHSAEMEKVQHQERTRTDSVDSGIGTPARTAGSTRVSLTTAPRNHRISTVEQGQLFLEKMLILEKKLQSMESQLKNEQVQRLALEAKVVKLERDNEQLKASRTRAGLQLHNFAERFYSETETIKIGGSCNTSPHPSIAELHRRSRTDSLSSNSSQHSSNSSQHSRHSRFSHVSM